MTRVIEFLGKGLALAGFIFTVVTYAYNLHIDRQQERYKQATAMVERYNTAGIRGYENELIQRLLYYNASGYNVNSADSYSDQEFDLIAKETLFGFDGQSGAGESNIKPFLGELMDIIDFYARAGFCVRAEICDSLIIQYFCPRVATFKRRNQRLMTYYKEYEGSEGYSNGLDSFSGLCAGEEM